MDTIRRSAFLLALAALPLLAACGNKGPLVMPQKPVPVEDPAPAPPASSPVEPDAPAPGDVPTTPAGPLPVPEDAGADDGDG
ncbi:lipoprotein [Pseudoxanthomonas sp. SGT-18]|uniref:LPS translocon maturation chaperone LptM n=1 Tax=Pseudoxanthomonas sp. SGT-18 TaxID=2493087 RepID=UPI000F628ABB|nr:lipoprotein [Pseudoxanthomonas sp. SGT-18]